MDEIREKPSIVRYIYCVVAVIMLLCGLTYLLSSCTEIVDGPAGKKGKGVRIPVNFSVHIGTHSDEEEVQARSLNAKNEPVTDMVRVKGDVYMYATLEEDHPVTTRAATTNLPDGSLVRIAAYNTSTPIPLFEDTATYIASSGELLPLYNGLFVPDNEDYRFVAYSLNTHPMPNQNATTLTLMDLFAYYPNADWLWGFTDTTQPITASDVESIDITLNHLLTRVRVEATTEAIFPAVNINRIGQTTLHPPYEGRLNLDLFSGVLTTSSGITATGLQITRWRNILPPPASPEAWGTGTGNLNSQNVESDYVYIFTNKADTNSLKLNNLNIGGSELGDFQFRITKRLLPGHSYTIKLNFRELVWSGSNVYWDDATQKLTFLPETTPEAAQGYQGVYFMWGSLVGISPQETNDPSSIILYVPLSGSSWGKRYAATQTEWTGTTMADIPRIKTGEFITNASWLDDHSTRNYLFDIPTPAYLTGDICKYLTERGDAPEGEWRMPNAREFGASAADYNLFYLNAGWSSSAVDVEGTSNFLAPPFYSYAIKTTASNKKTIFPGGGYRMYENGSVIKASTIYLSGSPTVLQENDPNKSQIFDAFFGMDLATPPPQLFPRLRIPLVGYYQGPVRCVKIEGNAIFLDLDQPTADVEDWDPGGTFGQGDTDGQGNLWY